MRVFRDGGKNRCSGSQANPDIVRYSELHQPPQSVRLHGRDNVRFGRAILDLVFTERVNDQANGHTVAWDMPVQNPEHCARLLFYLFTSAVLKRSDTHTASGSRKIRRVCRGACERDLFCCLKQTQALNEGWKHRDNSQRHHGLPGYRPARATCAARYKSPWRLLSSSPLRPL